MPTQLELGLRRGQRRATRPTGITIAGLLLALLAVLGCSSDRGADVRALEMAFPTLAELRVDHFLFDGDFEDCAVLVYRRGAFASDQECALAVTGEENVATFDAQSRSDAIRIREAASGAAMIWEAHAEYNPSDGLVKRAMLSLRPGVDYHYAPGYSSIPRSGDSLKYERVDENWYVETISGVG